MKYILWIYIICTLFLDRITKEWASWSLGKDTISLLGEWLQLRLAYNSGIAFSLPLTGALQVLATVVIILGVEVYAFGYDPTRKKTLTKFGYASVLTGALSNGFDRIYAGQVVDFVSLKHFAIFNVADILITLWAILLVISHIQHERSTRK